jgi:chromosome segregation ATPase
MDHKKYHLIQTRIEEARTALKVWNDRRAEVMIELDSIFTEVDEYKKQLSEEKENSEKTITELKTALEKSELDYHKHFEVYTNDMQELKLTNENLSRQAKAANAEVETLKREMKRKDADHLAKLSRVSAEIESKHTEQQLQLKTQVANLIVELQSLQNEKKNISLKAKQFEKELRVIRNQMMSFLNVTKEVTGSEVASPIVVSAESLEKESVKKVANKLQEPVMMMDITANPPATVDEYLKRFGY